jgi:hypothetical protein
MGGRRTRFVAALVMALLFGIVASAVKGNGAGVRDGIGNLSAPWVIVPLLAGAVGSPGRIAFGALMGAFATLAALVGFYLANAFVLDLGSHSTFHDVGLTLNAGNLWFKAGAVSGPVMGAVGAWAIRRGGVAVAGIAIASVAMEPLVVYLAYVCSKGYFAAGNGQWNAVYAGEAGAGAIAGVALWRTHATRRASEPGG